VRPDDGCDYLVVVQEVGGAASLGCCCAGELQRLIESSIAYKLDSLACYSHMQLAAGRPASTVFS